MLLEHSAGSWGHPLALRFGSRPNTLFIAGGYGKIEKYRNWVDKYLMLLAPCVSAGIRRLEFID